MSPLKQLREDPRDLQAEWDLEAQFAAINAAKRGEGVTHDGATPPVMALAIGVEIGRAHV